MPAISHVEILPTTERLVMLMESEPLSQGFHLPRETAGQSDSQSPELTGNWQKRENTEHSDSEDDIKLHELMEAVKRYIRSIDVSNL